MATEIETTLPGRRITAGPTELYIEDTEWSGRRIRTKLRGDDAKKVADALDPGRGTYPSGSHADEMARAIDRLTADRDEANARADAAEARVRELEKRLPKVMSDYQDLEDEARPAVTRADIEKTVRRYIPSTHFSEPIADEVCALFGIEDEQPADPVEKLAKELWPILHPDEAPWRESVSMSAEGTMHGAVLRKMMGTARAAAAHVLGQEADHA